MTTLVKICGLTDAAAVNAAIAGGANAVGFVFAASVRRLQTGQAIEIAGDVPPDVKRVAVMMHPTRSEWEEVREAFRPDVLQTDIEDFATLEVPDHVERWPVIREGRTPHGGELPTTFIYEGSKSGSGQKVDWAKAAKLARRGNLILAGGISAANVAAAIREVAPFGVDVSSAVESEPGRKDIGKIQAFMDAVKAAEQERARS